MMLDEKWTSIGDTYLELGAEDLQVSELEPGVFLIHVSSAGRPESNFLNTPRGSKYPLIRYLSFG